MLLHLNLLAQPLELQFISVGKEKGLSNSNTTCITQDSLGYIWIGTQDGLNRYDGFSIIVYKLDTQDSTSLPHNAIRTLYTDAEGTVWIGTENGVCYYEPYWDGFKRIALPTAIPGQEITIVDHIAGNPAHGLLYCMANKIYRINPETNTSEQYLEIESGEVTSFLFDPGNNLWISAFKGGGLYKFNTEKELVKHYKKVEGDNNSLSSNSLWHISLRNGEELWIATEDEGINRLDINRELFTRFPYQVYDEKFTRYTYVDRENRVWIGDHTGIKLYDDAQGVFNGYYTDYKDVYSIRPNAYAIYHDMQGNYWVLHLPGGASMSILRKGFKVFSDNPFETWHTQNQNVSAVQEDSLGNLFLGNPFNGLDIFYWTRNTVLRYQHDSQDETSLGSGHVFVLKYGPGGMWIGTHRGGLQLLDANLKEFRCYMHDPDDSTSISGNDVRGISFDRKGNAWIAVHGKGVAKFDLHTGIFRNYNQQNSQLSNDWTFEVTEDHLGNIWVATSYGLSRLPEGEDQFVSYFADVNNPNTLSDNEIITVLEDSMYRVWIGTSQGLNYYNRERDIIEPIEGVLREEYICSILDDNKNTLWIATLNGLYNYDPATGNTRRFDESDGLPTNEFNNRARYKNTLNDLFFGTIDGVVLFDPNELNYNLTKPIVVITNFKLFNIELTEYGSNQPLDRHISYAKEVRLHYDQNMISFGFNALSMINPEKNEYAYMLEGFDDDWNYIGSRREATYTNLDPGKYVFRVIASNNDGVWNKEGASIKVIVYQPWWKALWFRILVVLLVILSFISFFYLRTGQLRKQKQVLEDKVRQSTLELQEKNKQLMEKSNHLNEINTLLEERQQEILEKSTKLQELNTSKDRLFSIIAHDLTSPFNSILGFTELLHTTYEEMDKEERQEMAASINESARRVYSLLDNLLNWARTQTNRIKYDPISLDLESLAKETLEVYKFRLDKKKISYEVRNKTKSKAFADTDMVQSILRNLLSNATKYTPEKGKISIIIEQDGNEVRTSIEDTGIGISKGIYNNLFNLDKSSSQEGTDGEKGSGIGLILTNEFIGLNGGTLSIRSKDGEGSTFSFTLPMSKV